MKKASIKRRSSIAIMNVSMGLLLAFTPVSASGSNFAQTQSVVQGLSDSDNIGVDPGELQAERYPIPANPDVTIRATDYGVIADDERDDTIAMISVLQEAGSYDGQSVHIVLPEGRLDFIEGMNPAHPDVGIYIEGLKNTVISGHTKLMFHGEFRAIELNQCEDVLIHGIAIDYGRPPFSVGTLTGGDGKVLEVTVDAGYPVGELVKVAGILEFDPATNKPLANGNDIYGNIKSVKYLGAQKLRIELMDPVDISPIGTTVILRHQIYGLDGITVKSSERLKFESVTMHTAMGMGFMGYSSNDLYFNRFNIVLPSDTDRLMTVTADGMHFMDIGGDLVVTNSIFENMGDDALNAHGAYLVIQSKTGTNSLHASNPRGYNFPPQIGDTVEVSDTATLQPAFSAAVTAVEPAESGFNITLDQAIPSGIKSGDVIANATRTPKLVFKNNVVRNKRSRGVLIQTRDALVENNTFANISGGGVLVTTDVGEWFESISSRDVVIRNNKFVGNNFAKMRTDGDIAAVAFVKNNYGSAGVFQNLTIENNFIANTGNAGIFIYSADGVQIRNNLIYKSGIDASHAQTNSGIGLSNSANIVLNGNDVVPTGSLAFQPVYIGAGVDFSAISIAHNRGFGEEIFQNSGSAVLAVEKIAANSISADDGSLQDWQDKGTPISNQPYTGLNEAIREPADFKVEWAKIAWDDSGIYFAYEVTDDMLTWVPGSYWTGDGVEIFMTSDTTSGEPMDMTANVNPDQAYLVMGGSQAGGSFVSDVRTSPGVYAARSQFELNLWEKLDGKGYYGEGKIPFAAMPGIQDAIENNDNISFAIRFADKDTAGEPQIQISNAMHPIEFNKYTPSGMPKVKFVSSESQPGEGN